MMAYRRNMYVVFLIIAISCFYILVIFPDENPLNYLPQKKQIFSTNTGQESDGETRIIRKFTLKDANLGTIKLAVSLPNPLPEKPLPVLFILGGLKTGIDSIHYVSNIGNNILIGYDWPIEKSLPRGLNIFLRFPRIYQGIYNTPGQIAAAIEWVATQPWAEKERISLLGFSVGAIAVPAAQHIVQSQNNVNIGWTVLAYGGANLGQIVNHNTSIRPNWPKPIYGWILQYLFDPVDPKNHLPFISGKFLLISTTHDRLIPEASSNLMQELTAYPKDFVTVQGGHIGVGENQELRLAKIIKETTTWLNTNGAINP